MTEVAIRFYAKEQIQKLKAQLQHTDWFMCGILEDIAFNNYNQNNTEYTRIYFARKEARTLIQLWYYAMRHANEFLSAKNEKELTNMVKNKTITEPPLCNTI